MSPSADDSQHIADLESVISTAELSGRPSRLPDHAAENRALVALAREITSSPTGILHKLVETALALCCAHSAGISLLADDRKTFYWPAIAGQWAGHMGLGTPRDFGPCGTVLDRNVPLLFSHPERHFSYLAAAAHPIEEALLIPFYLDGVAVGTIWIIAHDQSRRFDREDLRLMTNLGAFAAAAYHTVLVRDETAKAMQELQHTAAVLCETEGNLRHAMDLNPQVPWTARPDGVIENVGERWLALTGLTHEDALAEGWKQVSHPDDRCHIAKAWSHSVGTGESYDIEHRIRLAAGEYRWVRSRAFSRRDEEGRIVRWYGWTEDIHERKEAELALRRSEGNLTDFFDNSAIGLHWVGADGLVLRVNQAELDLLGYTREEYLGHHIAEFHADQAAIQDILARLSGGETLRNYEARLKCKDGSIRDVLISSNVLWEDAQFIHTRCFTRDITERVRAEKALRESEERYRSLFNSIDEGFCVVELLCDAHGKPADYRFVEVNPAFEKQSGLRDMTGKRMLELAPDHEAYWCDVYGKVALTGEPVRFAGEAKELRRWFDVYAFRLGGQDSRKVAVLFNDITERKQAEEAIRRVNDELEARVEDRTRDLVALQQRLRALAAEVNVTEQRERQRLATELHDYLAQLLALTKIKLAQAKQQPMAPPLAKALSDMQSIMDQALAYTRTLVAQLSPPLLSQFGLSIALRGLAEQMQQQDLTVSLELERDSVSLPEDQSMLLFQSARELLINIVKHGKTNHARMSMTQTEGHVTILVTDQGAGFDPAVAGQDQTGAVPTFGLFSIRERMLALGGRLELVSAPGQGTTATLVLPLTPKAVSAANAELGMLNDEVSSASPMTGQQQAPTTKDALDAKGEHSEFIIQNSAFRAPARIRVLMADDHAMVRQGLRGLLDAYADIQIVGEAANGEEAVDLAGKLQPNVVLMDVNMPRMDGIEATRRIKQESPAVLVIGLSVQNVGHVGDAMAQAGAVLVLNKEAAVEDLYQTIQSVMKKRNADAFSSQA